MFYLLSLLTGILECGWIFNGISHSMPLWQCLCYPLAYHLGNLFPKPFALKKKYLFAMGAISLFITAFLFIFRSIGSSYIPQDIEFILTCARLFFISAVIQSVRSDMKQEGKRLLKRVFRVGGFLLAVLAVWIPEILLFAANIAAIVSLPKYIQKPCITRLKSQGGYSAVMLFHQLHYFFYAHITLAAVSFAVSREPSPFGFLDYAFERNPQICGIAIGALLFCGTWITYMSVEPLVSRLTKDVTPVFYIGHSVICLLLLVMSQFTSGTVFILLWLLTGFGGGTVYTISERARAKGKYDKSSMTVSENLGHTFGLLSAVVIAAFLGNAAPYVMLVCGSASAFLAILCMTLTIRKEKQHESIKDNG